MARALLPVLVLAACSRVYEPTAQHASADPAADAVVPAPSVAYYEAFSPITQAPSVARTEKDALSLPRFLEVKTSSTTQEIVFRPEGRMVWKLRRSDQGIVEKITLVDGEEWSRTRFTYDSFGRRTEKRVELSGGKSIVETYAFDATNRLTERRRSDGSEIWKLTYGTTITAETTIDGKTVRRDVFDTEGRILETHLGRPVGAKELVLTYARDPEGKITAITRTTATGKPRPIATSPDPTIVAEDLARLPTIVERHEVLMLFGPPTTRSVTGKGVARETIDRYAGNACWMNQPSAVQYDPADLSSGIRVECICGFCVDSASAPHADDAIGYDEHFTEGPWIRLDGHLDVTADHALATPDGPRLAGTLTAGDVVLAEDGTPKPLLSVERLFSTAPRLGKNLRTTSGFFAAGGLRFVSEQPRACN
ncbi:MAG: hypothetical protein ACXVEF_26865 [Polyangiales bacterium]